MSKIKINISKVRSDSSCLSSQISKLSNITEGLDSLKYSVDGRIRGRRNIGSRLNSASSVSKSIEKRLKDLQKFIENSMDRYEKTEKKINNKAEAIEGLAGHGLGTGIDLYTLGATYEPTTSKYVQMFNDGGNEELESEEDDDTKSSSIDAFITSASTAGGVSAADKSIRTASEKGLLGERTYKVATGINRRTRRAFGYAKEVEEVKSVAELREGFGVANVVLSTGTVYEDWKNNDTLVLRECN